VFPVVPVMVAGVEVATAVVVIANVADLAPAATVTLAGVTALVLLDERLTTVPPVAPGPFRVTVPVDGDPPITDVGESVKLERTAGVIVSVAVTEVVPVLAVMRAGVEVATAEVVTMNVADVAPDPTVTVAGVTALGLLDDNPTTVPPGCAGPFNVTVPVDDVPPTTDAGENARPVNEAGVTVKVIVLVALPNAAVIVAETEAAVGIVATVKDTEVDPARTVALVGGLADVLLDDRLTRVPSVGAGPVRVTVPVDDVPPTTEVGETVIPDNPGGVTVNTAVIVVVPEIAVIVAAVDADTGEVETVKVADVAPDGTVTLFGGTALVVLEVKSTTVPPYGAGPFSVTVPVDDDPPTTDVGDSDKLVGTGGRTVSVVDTVVVPVFAVIVAAVDVATAEVVIVKVADVAPPETVTIVGGTAQLLLDDTLTIVPPTGAAALSVTVPVDGVTPTTEVGETVMLLRPGLGCVPNA